MHIGFVIYRCWPGTGGAENLLRHLGAALAVDHEVTVLARRTDDDPSRAMDLTVLDVPHFDTFVSDGVRSVQLTFGRSTRRTLRPLVVEGFPIARRYAHTPLRRHLLRFYAAAVAPIIAEQLHGVDVVHSFSGDLLGAAAVEAARLLDVPSVVSPFAHAGQYGDGESCGWLYRKATAITGLLEADLDVYRRLGVPEEALYVCPPGVPPLQQGNGKAIRKRFGIDGPLVLFIGVKRPYKGAGLLAAAADILVERHPGVTVALVGPGKLDRPSSGPGRVLDVGCVDEGDRAAWLRAADVFCLPSEFEIFPLSVLEAWSVGVPVVLSDIPTLSELICRSRGGVVSSRTAEALSDSLAGLLDDVERRNQIGAAGREFWKSGHLPAMAAERYLQVYERAGAIACA